mgnify:CR=1 FL=1
MVKLRRDEEALEKDVKITLIATGFVGAKSSDTPSVVTSKKMGDALNELRTNDEQMDVPSFLRLPMFNSRRSIPAAKPAEKPAVTLDAGP